MRTQSLVIFDYWKKDQPSLREEILALTTCLRKDAISNEYPAGHDKPAEDRHEMAVNRKIQTNKTPSVRLWATYETCLGIVGTCALGVVFRS